MLRRHDFCSEVGVATSSNSSCELTDNNAINTNTLGVRGSVRSTRGLGPTMIARGQSIGISIGMLPQTLIMSITVQKTSKYDTTEFDLEEGF